MQTHTKAMYRDINVFFCVFVCVFGKGDMLFRRHRNLTVVTVVVFLVLVTILYITGPRDIDSVR